MTKFKMFEGTVKTVENDTNAYLENHPNEILQSIQLCNDGSHVVMAAVFTKVPVPARRFNDTGHPSLPMRAVEITCDPWQGEFIPVGDPPMRQVSYEKNSPEQFGGGVH